MIPLLIVIGFRVKQHTVRLWLPLFLAWLLLLPVVLLLLPMFWIACLLTKVHPWRALATGWQVLTGLKGTHVEIDDSKSLVLIRIV